MTKPIKLIYEFNWKNISVYIDIDFRNGKISLVEPESWEKVRFKDKNWLFAGRDREFMAGWKNILEAMEKAIEDAESKLKKYQDDMDDRMIEMMLDIDKEMSKKKK